MLSELRVRDLGVIADLTLELGPGMTALTGETGAGKTLLVQALQVVLGGRVSSGIVRAGAPEAMVEARFVDVAVGEELEARLGATALGAEAVLARAVAATGRSRSWIDGRMAPVAALAEVGGRLVEILGQHEQQTLLAGPAQRGLLDRHAGADLAPLRRARAQLADVERQLEELGGDERERARLADLLRYQLAEIDDAGITDPDEDAALAAEEERLADVAALQAAAATALAALDGDGRPGGRGETDASALVGSAVGALAGRAALADPAERLRRLLAELDDVASDLRTVIDTWEDDPERLEAVLARRRLLGDLRRKYGETLAEVVAFADDARGELDRIERQAEIVAELEGRRAGARQAVADAEAKLRAVRAKAAPGLGKTATARLRGLAMPDATLEVTVGDDGPGDAVSFLLGANRGEPLQPLARVASGGELARTMLALRLVGGGGAPTMLFDEVDAGVGGGAALALAAALAEVAVTRQVLVVTHLAQVAAFADHQVAVHKAVTADGRTVASAEVLSGEQRVVELSRMLSGHPDSATARAHAEELLGAGAQARPSTIGRRRSD